MDIRTVGVEEELLLLDPATRQVSARAREVLKGHREHGAGREPRAASDELDQELFLHQVETRTDPTTDVPAAVEQLRAARRSAGLAAREAGLAAVACGIAPVELTHPRVSPDDRYRDMVDTFGEVARSAGTCGMHIHVGIGSDDEGVAVIDRLAPWLPVLLAVSANSPYAASRDTGYASWRSQVWGRWPSAGPTEAFGSMAGYRAAADGLLASGAARDRGMLYFDARLSEGQPTVEVRVFDVCTDPADAGLLVALTRALVEHAARGWSAGEPADRWRSEQLRGAQWRAARWGLGDTLMHPLRRELRPAREVLESLVELVGSELDEAGDLSVVEDGVPRVLRGGGATRQRAAFERSAGQDRDGIDGVVDDLVERSERAWALGPVF
ncbi:carboxylate-amine ligase [Nocardioides ferulae]|uniref:carboxylate-amine ligase n=1 Tax=Nocardioides ferulae TaxID=2340821 RepID=UPI000EB5A457|nr:glutamate--cysteine ligase [Nocardioides ferulae]